MEIRRHTAPRQPAAHVLPFMGSGGPSDPTRKRSRSSQAVRAYATRSAGPGASSCAAAGAGGRARVGPVERRGAGLEGNVHTV